jgi:phosphatidylserine/phosphatidylglycerophosphate/cardiolipin synthase-like enzyme
MSEVWNAIAELCLELHPDRVAAIASGISGVSGVKEIGRMRESFGPNAGKELFRKLREAWEQSGSISPAEIAAGLKCASAAAAIHGAKGSVELVWSGPETQEFPVRQTEEVICQVVESSRTKLLVISFAVYRIERILKCLEAARARGVALDVLVEASEAQGGNVSTDGFALFRKRLPTARLWIWDKSGSEGYGGAGSVHGKCIVGDEDQAFISSANLTSAAMHKNIEIGILVKGGNIPLGIRHAFHDLTQRSILAPA